MTREAWLYHLSGLKVWKLLCAIKNEEVRRKRTSGIISEETYKDKDCSGWAQDKDSVPDSFVPSLMSGGHSEVAPRLPIPNRTVKRLSADDSAVRPCESRSSPDAPLLPPDEVIRQGVSVWRSKTVQGQRLRAGYALQAACRPDSELLQLTPSVSVQGQRKHWPGYVGADKSAAVPCCSVLFEVV